MSDPELTVNNDKSRENRLGMTAENIQIPNSVSGEEIKEDKK